MIHIAICDDERYMLDKLKKLVSDFFYKENIQISILQFSSGEELLNYNKPIEVLFLDIQMKNMNGMETAKKLRNHNFRGVLIFVTILKELVFQAFEVQAFDYLLKPIEEEHFKKVMNRLLISLKSAKEKSLFIQRKSENRIIFFDDIIFCEIMNRKVYLHLQSEEIIDYYDKIENLETKLDRRFFRCHRSYLINLKYLKSFRDGLAYMNNGETIPVSRLRSKEFTSVILQYMKEWR